MSISSNLWRRWVAAFTLGELIGFGGIPVVGAMLALWATTSLDLAARSLILYAVAIIGGLGEGVVLAWFQWRVLRDHWPRLRRRRWLGATAGAAAFAWACGMLAPTLDDLIGLEARAQVLIWIPASVLILISIGSAQAWALAGVAERPQRWLIANVLGWLAGLPWTFVLPALLPESTPTLYWAVTFLIAGVLMGATAGAVTGAFLIRIAPVTGSGHPHD